jgi:6-pyruvoyltetrahydropterin/6-carboxytetrahydropterin synthase
MYELNIDAKFAAAHRLRSYKGDCARLHGHTWKVTASISAYILDEIGITLDFKDISRTLDAIVERFDHQNLNDLEEFKDVNPTAENIAKLFFDKLSAKIDTVTVRVISVTVAESEKYRVTYRKENGG